MKNPMPALNKKLTTISKTLADLGATIYVLGEDTMEPTLAIAFKDGGASFGQSHLGNPLPEREQGRSFIWTKHHESVVDLADLEDLQALDDTDDECLSWEIGRSFRDVVMGSRPLVPGDIISVVTEVETVDPDEYEDEDDIPCNDDGEPFKWQINESKALVYLGQARFIVASGVTAPIFQALHVLHVLHSAEGLGELGMVNGKFKDLIDKLECPEAPVIATQEGEDK